MGILLSESSERHDKMVYKNIFRTFCNNDECFISGRAKNTAVDRIDSSRMQTINLRDGNNDLISCRFYPVDNPKRLIIALHDYKSRFERDFSRVYLHLRDNSCSIFTFDMAAHSESGGEFFTFGIKERHACLHVINFVCEHIADDIPVYVYGMGAGGAVALMTCGMKLPKNVHGFIADSAYSHPYKYIRYNLMQNMGLSKGKKEAERLDGQLMKKYGLSMHDYAVSEAFKSVNRPVIFFHGKKDSETPFSFARENYISCIGEKDFAVFENSEHLRCCYDEYERYCTYLDKFFSKNDSREFDEKIRLHYPEKTMFQLVKEACDRLPDDNAYSFKGKVTTYRQMVERTENAAGAFLDFGIKKGDVVTICMPNTPQAVDCFYALNRIGAVASLIHPLSAESEIECYLKLSESKMILTADLFYEKTVNAVKKSGMDIQILVARIQDELKPHLSLLYTSVKGKDYLRFPDERGGMLWSEFVKTGDKNNLPPMTFEKNRPAVILYSGGTTGEPKGILLSDFNFNALAMQARVAMECEFSRGLKNLSVMPIFHGFGLGIGIHMVLIHNACCVLMPQVNTKEYVSAMLREKPNFIAGVPTIFKMLIESDRFNGEDLSFLKGMFVGGDSMPVDMKTDVDNFLKNHYARIQVREGYGLTECVTASCLTPKNTYKKGSIGLPFPDMLYKIVAPDTENELPYNAEGEIVISGPTVMLGYLDNPEATRNALRVHKDGRVWLHTGDMGKIDEDGYVYFKQRIKRMIVSSGYNVYPSQVEKAIELHPAVDYCCVIGVHDEFRIQSIKAYVVLKDKTAATQEMKKNIIDYCRKYIAAYELPREIEFRTQLPKTLVGKVAYRKLEEENEAV